MRFTWEEHMDIDEEDFQSIINNYVPYHREKQKKVRSKDIHTACLEATSDYYEIHFKPYIKIPYEVQIQIANEVEKRYKGE